MRIILTLDDDVAAGLERVRRTRGVSLEQVVNEALRLGLRQLEAKPQTRGYRTPSVNLGGCLIGSVDNVAESLAAAEGESFP